MRSVKTGKSPPEEPDKELYRPRLILRESELKLYVELYYLIKFSAYFFVGLSKFLS